MAAQSPQECKQFGREVANYKDDKWDAVRLNVVVEGNVAKFTQNENLKAYILGTANDILVEATPQDKIWGIGLDRDDPLANNPLQWRGLNLLGFALVKVREILRGRNLDGSAHE